MKTKIKIHCESDFGHMHYCAFRGEGAICLKVSLPKLDSGYEQVCRSARSNQREGIRRHQPGRRLNSKEAPHDK